MIVWVEVPGALPCYFNRQVVTHVQEKKYFALLFIHAVFYNHFKQCYERYTYLELQGGFWPIPDSSPFLLGGGAGYMYYKEGNITKRRPIATIDLGCFVFAAFDVIFLENNETSKDFGFMGVFPIPLYGYDFNFD